MPERVTAKNPIHSLLPVARTNGSHSRFATQIIRRKPNFWSMVVAGDAWLPVECLSLIVKDFRKRFITFKFEEHHLQLSPDEFVELFLKEPIYRKLREAIGRNAPLETPIDRLEPLYGSYVGVYLCEKPGDKTKDAVAVDGFRISSGGGGGRLAIFEQTTNPYSSVTLTGFVRLRDDTVEMQINWVDGKDPDTTYMGALPKGDQVDALLTVSVDIVSKHRLVACRPTLFLRVEKLPEYSGILESDSELFQSVKAAIAEDFPYNESRHELRPEVNLKEKHRLAIEAALRREPLQPVRI